MEDESIKGHEALRRGRFSAIGATYFITISTDHRYVGLTTTGIATSILANAKTMDDDMSWKLRCATIMPDHVHLLLTLGDRLPLEKTISRLKSKTSIELHSAKIKWARGFFDRRLREDDSIAAVIRYVYMNPYRTNPPLIQATPNNTQWPWFFCAEDDWDVVEGGLEQHPAPPTWL